MKVLEKKISHKNDDQTIKELNIMMTVEVKPQLSDKALSMAKGFFSKKKDVPVEKP